MLSLASYRYVSRPGSDPLLMPFLLGPSLGRGTKRHVQSKKEKAVGHNKALGADKW
jgi:hypothetical protein